MSLAALLVALGVGGTLGALASAALAGGRLAAQVELFDAELRTYLGSRTDVEAKYLLQAWEALGRDLRSLSQSLQRLARRG